MTPVESQLLARMQEGDETAFGRLVDVHAPGIRAVARQLCGDAEEALDIAQEVFVRLFRHRDRLDPGRPLRPWLLRVTTRLAIDVLRRRGTRPRTVSREQERLPDPVDPAAGPDALAEANELHAALDALCAQLSPQQRQVFVLRDLQGLPVSQIAELLDCAPSTVRVHLAAARGRLRPALRRYYPEAMKGGSR